MNSNTSIPQDFESQLTSLFDDKQKITVFNKIASLYFNKNFGTTSKADFELLMFSFFIRNSKESKNLDSDYLIANQLGITDSRVRTLKEKLQLRYPDVNYNWKQEFLRAAVHARLDDKKGLIKFSIKDVNVLRDVRNYIIEKGYYDEFQRNPCLFQCPYATFINIGVSLIKEDQSLLEKAQTELTQNYQNYKDESFKKFAKYVLDKNASEMKTDDVSTLEHVKEFLLDSFKQGAKNYVSNKISVSLSILVKAILAIFL